MVVFYFRRVENNTGRKSYIPCLDPAHASHHILPSLPCKNILNHSYIALPNTAILGSEWRERERECMYVCIYWRGRGKWGGGRTILPNYYNLQQPFGERTNRTDSAKKVHVFYYWTTPKLAGKTKVAAIVIPNVSSA